MLRPSHGGLLMDIINCLFSGLSTDEETNAQYVIHENSNNGGLNVINNTFYQARIGVVFVGSIRGTIVNNIFKDQLYGAVYLGGGSVLSLLIDYNDAHGYTGEAYGPDAGAYIGAHNIYTDPLLTDAPGGDFSPSASSPCAGTGQTHGANPLVPTVDYDSASREAFDIGALISGAPAVTYIHNVNELQLIGNDPDYPASGTYEIANDFDCAETEGWNGGLGFYPLPAFSGDFNGADFTISNLFINHTDPVGLFSSISGASIYDFSINGLSLKGSSFGGLVITSSNSTVSNCHITSLDASTVTLLTSNTGGLIGNNSSTPVSNCSVSGKINLCDSTIDNLGGLIGYNAPSCDITGCTANVSIISGLSAASSSGGTGGLIGYNYADVSNSYHTGDIVISGATYNVVGGCFGNHQNSNVINCHHTGNISLINTAYVGGFAGTISAGSGSVSHCYSVSEVSVSGTAAFAGGFAGYLSSSGPIEYCFSNAQVYVEGGGTTAVGGFVGQSSLSGTLYRCHSHGSVYGYNFVGGFVGFCQGSVTLTECLSTSDTTNTGGGYLSGVCGGLIGFSFTPIFNCYAHGSVLHTGEGVAGGLIGSLINGSLTNCYSVGHVSATTPGGLIGASSGLPVVDSYWNTETSGQLTSADGTGKTTAEMKTRDTYVSWSFPPWRL
jgi:hypothetical protein